MENWKQEFIIENYDKMTYPEIANTLGISRASVVCFLKRKGIHKGKLTRLSGEEMQYILSSFDDNISYSEMSEHLGVKLSTLAKFLNNLGLTRYRKKNPGRVRRIQQAKKVSHKEFVEIKKNANSDVDALKAITLRKTSKRRWESSEDSLLLSLNSKRLSISIIAIKLNRSDIAIRARIYKLLNQY